MSFASLSDAFKNRGLTLSSIESFTGGSFASQITKIPGASKFFKGAVVTYATEVKVRMLKIAQSLVDQYGVVSNEVAREMCVRGRYYLQSDVCVSFTGNAGPSAMEGKPVGEVYIGLCSEKICKVFKLQLEGSREQIQNQAMEFACNKLNDFLKEI